MNLNQNDRNINRYNRNDERNMEGRRRYSNDDYSRYAGPDYREGDSSNYGPYDINRDFDNGEFRFGREEFGRDRSNDWDESRFADSSEMNRSRFEAPYSLRRSEDNYHPGVSGKSRREGRWLNRDQYQDQRNFAESDFGNDRWGQDYRFGPSYNNQRPQTSNSFDNRGYRGSFSEDEYGMNNDYDVRDYNSDSGFNWSRDTRSESFGERRNHSGKGPKGYRRSDERIKEEVCEALSRHPRLDASDMEVSVNEGHVTLSGRADSRHDKRMAESLIEHLPGVFDVHNQLKINKGLEGWIPGIGVEKEKNEKSGLS